MKMNKYVRKTLIGSGIFVGVVVLLLVIIAAFFEGQISKRLVKEINKQLKTELKVGEFNSGGSQGVNIRGLNNRIAVTAKIIPADVVCYENHNVGLTLLTGYSKEREEIEDENNLRL